MGEAKMRRDEILIAEEQRKKREAIQNEQQQAIATMVFYTDRVTTTMCNGFVVAGMQNGLIKVVCLENVTVPPGIPRFAFCCTPLELEMFIKTAAEVLDRYKQSAQADADAERERGEKTDDPEQSPAHEERLN